MAIQVLQQHIYVYIRALAQTFSANSVIIHNWFSYTRRKPPTIQRDVWMVRTGKIAMQREDSGVEEICGENRRLPSDNRRTEVLNWGCLCVGRSRMRPQVIHLT